MNYYNKKIILNVIARLDIHVPSFDYIVLNIPYINFIYPFKCDTLRFIIKNNIYYTLSEILFNKYRFDLQYNIIYDISNV